MLNIESTYLSGLFTTLKESKGYVVVRALAFHKGSQGSNTANTRRHRAIGGLNCCCFSLQSFARRSFPSGTDQIIFFSLVSAQNQFQLDQEWLMRNHFVKCDLWIVVFYYNIREQTTLRFHTYPRHINNSWISFIPLDIYNALANVLNLESKL